jgi:hypothetical protein
MELQASHTIALLNLNMTGHLLPHAKEFYVIKVNPLENGNINAETCQGKVRIETK